MTDRAVTPVLGLALLVGLVAAATISLFVISTAFVESTKASIDHDQAEESLSNFAEEAEVVTESPGQAPGQFELTGAQGGTVRAIPDDGDRINMTVLDENGSRVFTIDRELGSVVYDSPDGSQIAFQGGGVFRLEQGMQSVAVKNPPFKYRSVDDATLTFHLPLIRDEFSADERVSGKMSLMDRHKHYPNDPDHKNPLENGSVIIEVESIYCHGWEEAFASRTDGSVTEGCDARGITNQSEVRVVLSVPFTLDDMDTGVAFDGDVDDDNINDTNGVYSSGGHALQSPTRMVKQKVEDCETDGTDLDGNETIEDPGFYCADDDEMTGDQHYEINATGGDVEIAVAGDVYDRIKGSSGIDIEGEGNVSVYVDGDLFTGNGNGDSSFGNESNPSQLRFFVASGNQVGDNGNIGEIYAFIYAPTSDSSFGGDTHVEGGLVSQDAEFQGGKEYVYVDENVTDISVHYQPGDANIYFLHIYESELQFEETEIE